MEVIKQIVNHPLSKGVACFVIGALLIIESHSLYAGIAIGMGIREILLAFKQG
tara:strand:+ start:2723 stop:2881 length:159 start_codon:yes stop_codon:yes gene_type:complete